MEIVRHSTIECEQQILRLKKRIFYRPRLNVIEDIFWCNGHISTLPLVLLNFVILVKTS